MKMTLQLPKGTRDLKPEEAIVRNKIVSTLKEVFEIYGYSPLETPAFERFDILASKYAGGEEILKETGVSFVPGWGFGRTGKNAIRISFGPLIDDVEKIEQGLERVEKYLKNERRTNR